MAKPPRVIGVLTEPAPPTWWRAHRHQVFGIVGLFLGYQLCQADPGTAHTAPPKPAHSTPAPTATTR